MQSGDRLNGRILVIDDEESVREGFQLIFGTSMPTNTALDDAASLLFDDVPVKQSRKRPNVLDFQLDLAANGKEGITRVKAATEANLPYAVIFCDIRMPGMDGVETIEHIRKIDSRAEVVFITAYSDHSIETIVERAGANVSYFIKPFVTDEARQLATKLVLDWNKARELEELMLAVSSLRGDAQNIDRILTHLLRQTCCWLDTDSAALFRESSDSMFEFCLGVGELGIGQAPELADKLRRTVQPAETMTQWADGTMVLRVKEFGLLVALPGRAKLTPDRCTLLFTFLHHAALAIKNRETEVELARSQRMASIGQAVGYLLHDLRHPLGTTQMVLQLLRAKPELFVSVDDAFDMMEQEIQGGLDLVGDILSLCRAEIRIEPTVVLLRSAMHRVLRVWQLQLAQRAVDFVVDIADDLYARIDQKRVERVLSNLAKNALEAVLATDAGTRRIQVGARRVDLGVDIWVADSGIGIPTHVVRRLFEPFVTADKLEGVGFGLAIVKQIVDAHAGHIRVERIADTTRFTLFFPDNPNPS